MRKDIDILVTNGWTITFQPATKPNVGTSIIASASKGGISTVIAGDDPKQLLKQLFGYCVMYEPLLAAKWYNR